MRWMVSLCCAVGALLIASSAGATLVVTVGPDGAYPTVQAGIDQAISLGGNQPVLVETGTYHEHLTVPATFTSGTVEVIGGYVSGFVNRTTDPAATVIDGDANGRVLDLSPGGGSLVFDDLTFTNGVITSGSGAGMWLHPASSSSVELYNCRIFGNTVAVSDTAEGAGVKAVLDGTSQLELVDCVVGNNFAHSSASIASGGGLDITVSGMASAFIIASRIENNTARADGGAQVTAAGISALASDYGSLVLDDSVVTQNTGMTSGVCMAPGGEVAAGAYAPASTSQILMRRDHWVGNICSPAPAYSTLGAQLIVDTRASTLGHVSDSVISGGNGGGITGYGRDTSELDLTNLTVAGNTFEGVHLERQDTSSVSLANTIADLNDTDTSLTTGVSTTTNLVGTDPHFVDAAGGDYGVLADSPAIDQGTNTAPGVGELDVNRCARWQSGTVDIGASEQASVYCGGFELGGPFRWSVVVP